MPPAYRDDEIPTPPPLGSDHQTLARWLMAHPCNRPGADKSGVVHGITSLMHAFRTARLIEEPDAPVR